MQRLRKESAAREVSLDDYLGPDAVLVPVPRRAPRLDGALWPALELCNALRDAGLGRAVEPLLERTLVVPKSALIPRAVDRPSPRTHANSLRAATTPFDTTSLTLVDDVVTRGSTLLGCAAVLRTVYPSTVVRAFAFLRSVDDPVDHHAPHEGTIVLTGENFVHAR